MAAHNELGKLGEDIAANRLTSEGYEILERQWRYKHKEIDIIAQDKAELVFIEVKTRASVTYGLPKEAVNNTKKKHIYWSAEYYIYSRNLENYPIRIDVMEIYKKHGKFWVNHIKQAITEKPRK